MNVFIGYEASGVLRRAFREAGHDAWSCDLRCARDGSPFHIQADAKFVAAGVSTKAFGGDQTYYANVEGVSVPAPRVWDLFIVHPPCTYLSVSGQHWNNRRPERKALAEAALFEVAWWLDWATNAHARLALENPVGIISTRIRKADQYIHPYQFGDDASKKTGLWLVNLPKLSIDPAQRRTGRIVWRPDGRSVERWANQTDSGQNRLGPSADRADRRAETYPGIARAMVAAWGAK